MAARIKKELGAPVRMEFGGLGEISVHTKGEKLYDGPRLWYPSPGSILKRIREKLGTTGGG